MASKKQETLVKELDRAVRKLDEKSHESMTLEDKLIYKNASKSMEECRRQVKMAWFALEDAGF